MIRTIQIIKTAHFTFFFSKITTYAQYIADVEHILFYDLRIFVKNKSTFLFYLSKKIIFLTTTAKCTTTLTRNCSRHSRCDMKTIIVLITTDTAKRRRQCLLDRPQISLTAAGREAYCIRHIVKRSVTLTAHQGASSTRPVDILTFLISGFLRVAATVATRGERR